VKIHDDVDCPPSLGEPIAVIGYGSQGRAHAMNLRDSGEDVRVGLYPGSKSIERVEADGLRAVPVPEAVSEATVELKLIVDPIEKVGRELRSMMTWLEPVEK